MDSASIVQTPAAIYCIFFFYIDALSFGKGYETISHPHHHLTRNSKLKRNKAIGTHFFSPVNKMSLLRLATRSPIKKNWLTAKIAVASYLILCSL